MGAPDGGEAPSVEAKMSTAAAAIGIGTPTPARARTATGPTAAMVALAVRGMAIATTMRPNAVATLPSVDHQLLRVRGRLFRPRNSTRPIISTGIQVIRLITSDMAYGTCASLVPSASLP